MYLFLSTTKEELLRLKHENDQYTYKMMLESLGSVSPTIMSYHH